MPPYTGNEPVTLIHINLVAQKPGTNMSKTINVTNVSNPSTDYNFSGDIKPYTNYFARISLENIVGRGKEGTSSIAQTLETGEGGELWARRDQATAYSA